MLISVYLQLVFFTVSSTTINGDAIIKGALTCEGAETIDILAKGTVTIQDTLTTNKIEATDFTAKTVYASHIKSPTGTLTIKGNLHIRSYTEEESFLEESWSIHSHDTFYSSNSGWMGTRHSCLSQYYIGGGCEHSTVTKTFILPPHAILRVVANFSMLKEWSGEVGFMKLNGKTVWRQSGFTRENSIAVCGEGPDTRLSIPIEITVLHSEKQVVIEFGIEAKRECSAKFALGDIMVYTRTTLNLI